jgi:hypothetical protein
MFLTSPLIEQAIAYVITVCRKSARFGPLSHWSSLDTGVQKLHAETTWFPPTEVSISDLTVDRGSLSDCQRQISQKPTSGPSQAIVNTPTST